MKNTAMSEDTKLVKKKLQTDTPLTRADRKHEVTRYEAAELLSVLAGRTISPDYLRDLVADGRLKYYRQFGNTYSYQVEDLLKVRFTAPHDGTAIHPRIQAKLDKLNGARGSEQEADVLTEITPFLERNGYWVQFVDGSYSAVKHPEQLKFEEGARTGRSSEILNMSGPKR